MIPSVWNHAKQQMVHLLVIEHDVRQPDVLRRNVQHLHATILLWVPPEFVINPFLKQEGNL
jgi:hypothetical protein